MADDGAPSELLFRQARKYEAEVQLWAAIAAAKTVSGAELAELVERLETVVCELERVEFPRTL
jgi:hypothetical protein